jgi:hypothetical protein
MYISSSSPPHTIRKEKEKEDMKRGIWPLLLILHRHYAVYT